MTRQDLQLIADVIKDQRPDLPTDDMTDHGLDLVSQAFADRLALVNPRFNRALFLRACGVES
jgi:hypothetical protein